MEAPLIRLVTHEDMRPIDSRNLDAIKRLPFLYVPTDDPQVMRVWGVAGTLSDGGENTVEAAERHFPGTLVAPRYFGERPTRGDLIDMGAEPAAKHLAGDGQSKPGNTALE